MTAFTINTGGIVNYDTLTGGSTNATLDTYSIGNGSTLLINTDTYSCANHTSTNGSLDTVGFVNIGGKVSIDSTGVRIIAYTGGSGTVPIIGTTISRGTTATGYLLGVWSSWQVDPTVAGAAMPAAGFIKIKNLGGTTGIFTAGILTGITATCSGEDVQGWIEVRAPNSGIMSLSRVGKIETIGDWFLLGTTNGTAGQIISCPTTGTSANTFPGVWIESAPGSEIYEKYAGVSAVTVNGATLPTDVRGYMVWQTTGGIRIGRDGTNNVGKLPPAGCKVRIPSVILSNCARTAGSGSGPRVVPNTSIITRYKITPNDGDVTFGNVISSWYNTFNFVTNLSITNTILSDYVIIESIPKSFTIDNLLLGNSGGFLSPTFSITKCISGGTVQNIFIGKYLATYNSSVNSIANNSGITFTNNKFEMFSTRTGAGAAAITSSNNINCNWSQTSLFGGGMLIQADMNSTITDTHYADNFTGLTGTTFGLSVFTLSSLASNIVISGIDFAGLTNLNCFNALITGSSINNVKIRNIGTSSTPLNLGPTNASAYIFNMSVCNNIKLQRIYVANTRTGAWSATAGSCHNFTLENVQADYADVNTFPINNGLYKSVSITGSNASINSIYGTHWKTSFPSATIATIDALCFEPTNTSASQCFISSGTPKFKGDNSITLNSIGQQVTWEMPFYALGITALTTILTSGVGTANMLFEFQWNLGTGYNGTWTTLSNINVVAIGAIDPSIGIKLKIRATCTIAALTNNLTNIRINGITTSLIQLGNLYPLDVYNLTFTGVQAFSDIVILNAGTETELLNIDANAGTTYTYSYSSIANVDIGIFKSGYVPYYIRNYSLTTSDLSIPVTQLIDRNYIT